MPVMNIHVSRLTYKVLKTLYGPNEPFAIRRSDHFYYLLCQDPLRKDETVTTRFHRELNYGEVQIVVTENLARRLKANSRYYTVGWPLHKAMQFKMLDFIEAQALAKVPAQQALKMFFRLYDIEEDDYSLDTAYTAWKRHQVKFSGKSPAFYAKSRRDFDPRKWLKKSTKPLPDDKSWILHSVNEYYECGMVNLTCKSIMAGTFRYEYDTEHQREFVMARKVLCYLLNKDAQLSYVKIAQVINRHVTVIRRHALEIEMAIKTEQEDIVSAIAAIRQRVADRRPS